MNCMVTSDKWAAVFILNIFSLYLKLQSTVFIVREIDKKEEIYRLVSKLQLLILWPISVFTYLLWNTSNFAPVFSFIYRWVIYLCFISFLYLDLYVLGDYALIS